MVLWSPEHDGHERWIMNDEQMMPHRKLPLFMLVLPLIVQRSLRKVHGWRNDFSGDSLTATQTQVILGTEVLLVL